MLNSIIRHFSLDRDLMLKNIYVKICKTYIRYRLFWFDYQIFQNSHFTGQPFNLFNLNNLLAF